MSLANAHAQAGQDHGAPGHDCAAHPPMQPARDALITARGLGVGFGGPLVLRDVDFTIAPGEIVTVVGPNGSGKSVLLRALLGIVAPRRGQVTRRRGLRVGYVPQRLHIDQALPMPVHR